MHSDMWKELLLPLGYWWVAPLTHVSQYVLSPLSSFLLGTAMKKKVTYITKRPYCIHIPFPSISQTLKHDPTEIIIENQLGENCMATETIIQGKHHVETHGMHISGRSSLHNLSNAHLRKARALSEKCLERSEHCGDVNKCCGFYFYF